MPDIDIDFADRDVILKKLEHRIARLNTDKKHNTGVYFTEVPNNPVDKISTLDHKTADKRGYFKLDFLNVSLYKDIKNEDHLNTLIQKEPMWTLLEHTEFVEQLFHVGEHGSILKKMKPKSVKDEAEKRRTTSNDLSNNTSRKTSPTREDVERSERDDMEETDY